MNCQNTIKTAFTLEGRGLHTGQLVSVTLVPTEPNSGIVFRRVDLEPFVEIPAAAEMVVETARGTTLGKDGAKVATIEHLMSALHGMGVDNVRVELNGEEVPILDGSARYWVEEIAKAGICAQEAERKYFRVTKPMKFQGTEEGITFEAEPAEDFRVDLQIDFESDAIGHQEASIVGFDNYQSEIARCRTFVFLHEIAPLLALNLIKGGALDNALVFVDRPLEKEQMEKLAKLYGRSLDTLEVKNGVLNTIQPYFPNEPARHKLLDFVGDILLVGAPVKGHFTVHCPGHKNNVLFAQYLKVTSKNSTQMRNDE